MHIMFWGFLAASCMGEEMNKKSDVHEIFYNVHTLTLITLIEAA